MWSAFPITARLRIGDTLTEGENLVFRGVPSFAPEILRRVKLGDAMKAKKLREALQQMAEEGVVQLFLPHDGSPAMVGVVGALQLDVLAERLAGRIWPARELRDQPVRSLPLGEFGPAGGTGQVRRAPIHRHGQRSRRRAGVPGAIGVQPALRPGALAGDPFADIKDYQVGHG